MTTLTSCKKWMKANVEETEFVIVHTPGHIDRKNIDRGYTILPVNQVKDFAAAIDGYFDADGKQLHSGKA